MSESRSLPPRPYMRHLRGEAKRRRRSGEFPSLALAQLAVAREYGFRSWPRLKFHVDAVTLEAGEDIAKTGNPVVSSQHFLHELETPEFPWTGLTILLLIGVLAAAVGTRFLQLRSRQSATSPDANETGLEEPAKGV